MWTGIRVWAAVAVLLRCTSKVTGTAWFLRCPEYREISRGHVARALDASHFCKLRAGDWFKASLVALETIPLSETPSCEESYSSR